MKQAKTKHRIFDFSFHYLRLAHRRQASIYLLVLRLYASSTIRVGAARADNQRSILARDSHMNPVPCPTPARAASGLPECNLSVLIDFEVATLKCKTPYVSTRPIAAHHR